MTPKILIVDDEEAIRSSLARHFRIENYIVDIAENGIEAMKKLSLEPFPIVITDIMMPKMDGIDLLRRIKIEYPMVRAIVITGYITLDNALACMRLGADTCIFKPLVDLDELDGAVTAAIQRLEHWEKKLVLLKGLKNE